MLSIRQMIMPLFCLAMGGIATVTRQTRSSMLEVVRQDYVRTARSKGISEKKVIFLHALKNALIPVITILGMRLGSMLAGSMFVESVFNIPGMVAGNLCGSAGHLSQYVWRRCERRIRSQTPGRGVNGEESRR